MHSRLYPQKGEQRSINTHLISLNFSPSKSGMTSENWEFNMKRLVIFEEIYCKGISLIFKD